MSRPRLVTEENSSRSPQSPPGGWICSSSWSPASLWHVHVSGVSLSLWDTTQNRSGEENQQQMNQRNITTHDYGLSYNTTVTRGHAPFALPNPGCGGARSQTIGL
ncbi:unnamed protein product [Pleuronectes platessa]|uniref:Uncharacterized protein n=1 Tax=Pleuronectes platessa TaxID=8262 RepID=A0A9N7YHR2_PLEPL|nr:unnamed protein product [Pleuronectes platessa]